MTANKVHMLAVVLLASLCAGLAFGVYGELNQRPNVSSITLEKVPLLKASPDGSSPEPVSLPAVSELATIIDRPLFFQARQLPEPVPIASPEKKTKPNLTVTVSGIITTPNKRVALIKHPSANETLHLSVGDRVAEWQLEKITQDRVFLKWNDKIEVIEVENHPTPSPRTRKPRGRRSNARTAPAPVRTNRSKR